jgi:hypothetical protein
VTSSLRTSYDTMLAHRRGASRRLLSRRQQDSVYKKNESLDSCSMTLANRHRASRCVSYRRRHNTDFSRYEPRCPKYTTLVNRRRETRHQDSRRRNKIWNEATRSLETPHDMTLASRRREIVRCRHLYLALWRNLTPTKLTHPSQTT